LNCGKKLSAVYDRKKLDEQLDASTEKYLKRTLLNKDKNNLAVPALMSWFRGDFETKRV
jgi:hypothetical protein